MFNSNKRIKDLYILYAIPRTCWYMRADIENFFFMIFILGLKWKNKNANRLLVWCFDTSINPRWGKCLDNDGWNIETSVSYNRFNISTEVFQ